MPTLGNVEHRTMSKGKDEGNKNDEGRECDCLAGLKVCAV